MKVYYHEPKGVRFFTLLAFSAALLALNVLILPGQEALPVKAFILLFTLAWLAVTVDSLAGKVVVDEKGVGVFSILFRKFVGWNEITEISFGDRWVMGTFMPEHIIICYKTDGDKKTSTMTLHNDLKNWQGLLNDIVSYAPPGFCPELNLKNKK